MAGHYYGPLYDTHGSYQPGPPPVPPTAAIADIRSYHDPKKPNAIFDFSVNGAETSRRCRIVMTDQAQAALSRRPLTMEEANSHACVTFYDKGPENTVTASMGSKGLSYTQQGDLTFPEDHHHGQLNADYTAWLAKTVTAIQKSLKTSARPPTPA